MKSRIPKFKSLKAERKFWQKHEVTEFLEELEPVTIQFARPKKKPASIRLTGLEVRVLQGILARLARTQSRTTVANSKR